MFKSFVSYAVPLTQHWRVLTSLAWLLALGLCAWVTASLFWQFAAPAPVAAVSKHETDPRKLAARIGLHLGDVLPDSDKASLRDADYKVTGIATGFGSLPGFVILQAANGSNLSLSPGQTLPDGRRLVRLLPESVEFELDGRLTRFSLPAQDSELFQSSPHNTDRGSKRDN